MAYKKLFETYYPNILKQIVKKINIKIDSFNKKYENVDFGSEWATSDIPNAKELKSGEVFILKNKVIDSIHVAQWALMIGLKIENKLSIKIKNDFVKIFDDVLSQFKFIKINKNMWELKVDNDKIEFILIPKTSTTSYIFGVIILLNNDNFKEKI